MYYPVDAVNKQSASQMKLREDKVFTENELNFLYTEIKDFAIYLLNKYSGTKKTFFIVSSNELDNRLLAATNCYVNNTCNSPNTVIPDLQINKAIKYLDKFSAAINDAKAETNYSDIKVYHVCEIHDILDRGIKGKRSSINSIIPYTKCDLIAWSAYEVFV
jgi:hypothetical protein